MPHGLEEDEESSSVPRPGPNLGMQMPKLDFRALAERMEGLAAGAAAARRPPQPTPEPSYSKPVTKPQQLRIARLSHLNKPTKVSADGMLRGSSPHACAPKGGRGGAA